jgi:hypothetical protein
VGLWALYKSNPSSFLLVIVVSPQKKQIEEGKKKELKSEREETDFGGGQSWGLD